jgi:hypothetical protein
MSTPASNPLKLECRREVLFDPVLYLQYISDLPQPEETTVSTFADDTALMAVGGDVAEVRTKLQRAADQINNWSRQWLINPLNPELNPVC